jgi:hypothetical protein
MNPFPCSRVNARQESTGGATAVPSAAGTPDTRAVTGPAPVLEWRTVTEGSRT